MGDNMLGKTMIILCLLASTFVVSPVSAQNNACSVQVFAGASLQVTFDGGATYQAATPQATYALRNIFACPITAAVKLGQYQPIGFLIDQRAIVVWSSPDGKWYYVHREWRVYALTSAQWKQITALLTLNVAH